MIMENVPAQATCVYKMGIVCPIAEMGNSLIKMEIVITAQKIKKSGKTSVCAKLDIIK